MDLVVELFDAAEIVKETALLQEGVFRARQKAVHEMRIFHADPFLQPPI